MAFDFGGVLIHALVPAIHRLAERMALPASTLLHVLMGDPHRDSDHPWHRAERGELAVAEIQSLLAPHAAARGVVLGGTEIDDILSPAIDVNDRVVARVIALRAEGYQTALVTNSFREFRPTLEDMFDLGALFDVVVDSSEIGARKPSPDVYRILIERLGRPRPERVVFLDDFAGNVAGRAPPGLSRST